VRTAFHGALVLNDASQKENPIHFKEVDEVRFVEKLITD